MKTLSLKTGILTVVAICFCALLSNAQEEGRERRKPPTFKELIEKMDANEDGKLSKDEIKGRLKDHFDKVDTDEDGFITEEEFENMPKPEKGKRPSRDNK